MELTKEYFEKRLDEKLDQNLTEHRKESERYAGAILEEFQSRFAAFTEQFKDLPETVAAIRDKLDRTDEKVDMIYSIVMTELPTKVDREEFVGLKRRVSVLERRS